MNKINVQEANAKKMVDEIIEKIMQVGLYTMPKNELNDYLLFLLDKYSDEHFLTNFSNFDNAKLFKISEAKIKNSKLNIDLKFREENGCLDEITNFLAALMKKISGSITITMPTSLFWTTNTHACA